jgi:hypothetical protein
MTDNTFKLLDQFLALPEKEVSGHASLLEDSLKARLTQCAAGLLSAGDRAVLCAEIKDNRGALAFLAREIQTISACRNQENKNNEPRTNQPAA